MHVYQIFFGLMKLIFLQYRYGLCAVRHAFCNEGFNASIGKSFVIFEKVSQHTKGNNLCYLFIILLLRGLLLRFIWECPSRSLLFCFFFLFIYAEPFDIFMYCTGSLFMRCSYIVTQILIYLLYFFFTCIFLE